ncbi:MAG: LON peptidase substrate-binding domain-containing protein [Rhodospirillales bacterium]|nr:LON peptidase substrate-binding domain-containing protein [Rhodospirillales bacterium]MDE2576669.1 LON peptidase substrate-binding domain-containing protein [Rhodospirillales bacterium]
MNPFDPRPEDLPAEFAVFPLTGALLLPRARLPLNIFEPRYLAMVEDSLAAGRMFAMIQPDPARPPGPTGPGLYRIGCLGRLSSFSETDDGRLLITLTGLSRFHIAAELAMHRGYRRVRADFAAYPHDLAEAAAAPLDRAALLAALRAYFDHRGFNANWEAIEQMADAALVTTLCMACPFDATEKQALLEAASPSDRAAALLALLRIDTHAPNADPAGRRRAS